jgi:DNA-binding NarL/FixJ family response regulator
MYSNRQDVASFPRGRISVTIADRNQMSSQLLAQLLGRDDRFEVIAIAGEHDVQSVAISRKPDVAVISAEFNSVATKGIQAARNITSHQPGIHIVILLDLSERDVVVASFRNGARGVFCRTEPLSEFIKCVEHVGRGQIWASRAEIGYLLEVVKNAPSCDGIDQVGLSKREISVAEAAAQGFTNKQIADRLEISEHTVKNYLARIFEKSGVSNRIELLFLLEHKHLVSRTTKAAPTDQAEVVETHVKAAKDGIAAAQFAMGVAHVDGSVVEKDKRSAYYWLRRAELGSLEILQRSRSLIENLKCRMKPEDIEDIERRLAVVSVSDKKLVHKQLGGLSSEIVERLSRLPN